VSIFPTKIICDNNAVETASKSISHIVNNKKFLEAFKNCFICYEVITGCNYNCTFCCLKKAWKQETKVPNTKKHIETDLAEISKFWSYLKIIDDDFFQLPNVWNNCRFNDHFSKIIVETRVDKLTDDMLVQAKEFGVTHIILGVESFNSNFLKSVNKTSSLAWEKIVHNAINMCTKNNIISRPILMITAPHHNLEYLNTLKNKISDWKTCNGIEVLFSFFTPHPGLGLDLSTGKLLTNDLTRFDHLNLVYLPDCYEKSNINEIINIYTELVDVTGSHKFNPPLKISRKHYPEFECFFR
jgi:wyosine [tRNA(Phe)-imidazoG37] synthetase (radical SAM superfamily)